MSLHIQGEVDGKRAEEEVGELREKGYYPCERNGFQVEGWYELMEGKDMFCRPHYVGKGGWRRSESA